MNPAVLDMPATDVVQLPDDVALYATLSRFVGAAIAGGDGVVVIATAAHLAGLRERLADRGIDVARILAESRLVEIDATTTVASILTADANDRARVDGVLRDALARARVAARSGAVRVFDETGDHLVAEGSSDANDAVDRLWSRLVERPSVRLVRGRGGRPSTEVDVVVASTPAGGASADTSASARRLEDALANERAERSHLEALLRASELLASERELEPLVQRLADEAVALSGAVAATFVLDVRGEPTGPHATPDRVLRATSGRAELLAAAPADVVRVPVGDVRRIDDVRADPTWAAAPSETDAIASWLALPVPAPNGSAVGGLFLAHTRPAAFSEAHARLLTRLASQAAIAIENARSFQALRRAERAAESERQRLHDLFMVMPVAIWILRGPDHLIEFVNPVAAGLFPGRKLVGRPLREAIPDMDPARAVRLERVFEMGEPWRASEASTVLDWNQNGAPSERFFDVAYEPFFDESGAVAGVTTFGFDVTETVRARRRMQAIVEELEHANRAKDDFLATLSHELRTPLNAILGWARMLRGHDLPPEKHERALETIERNALGQAQLVDDLLDVSRIVSGKMRLEITTVDLEQVVTSAVFSLTPASDAKGVTVIQTIDPLAVSVLGDRDRLQQIVWNLVSNAIKFTPKGGHVTVASRRQDSSVEILVTDDGDGIDPAFLPHVFERFSQADPTKSRKHMGLGLGLAIVRHLVELHGGRVHVASEGLGRGATFRVVLPMSPLRGSTLHRMPAVRSPATTGKFEPPPELVGIHALIVEDEHDARELMVQVLAPCRMRISTAASAAEAMELIDTDPPSVIVSDIGMPGEDGYTFIRRVRARAPEKGGRIPAVALTAYTRVEDRTRALLAGFNMHVPKPVEPAELVAVLASLSSLFI